MYLYTIKETQNQGVMEFLSTIFSQFSKVGFSGSRSCPVASAAALSCLPCLPPSCSVVVGCAAGVDSAVRAACPSAVVFAASTFAASTFAGRLALRSGACVAAVASASGLWCAFPSAPCPPALSPSPVLSACFSGAGSGSWASLCFAVGSGVACLVCLPAGVPPPLWFRAFGFAPAGPLGFWFRPAPVVSLSLF